MEIFMNYHHNKSIKLLPRWRGYSSPKRSSFFTPGTAFLLGMFIGYMLPMWIKIATN